MQRHTPLARNTALARRTPLAKKSKARGQQQAAQRRAYGEAADAGQGWCSCCGEVGPTEHSHHYSQKKYPQHANDSRNWLVMGRYCGCHQLFENNRAAFAAAHPDLWRRILADLQQIDPAAFAAFRLKYPF